MKVIHQFDTSLNQYHIKHLALGFFDGLHLGHRSVIVNQFTKEQLRETCVVTFWPHPLEVLKSTNTPVLLTDLEEKIEILNNWDLGFMCVIPFNIEIANLQHDLFLRDLRKCFPNILTISVGPNFRFGKNRTGTPDTILDWSASHHITFNLADLVLDGQKPISSTRIRNLLATGGIADANRLLNRNFQISGTVIAGKQLGRTLGFPTANIKTKRTFNIPSGVYKTIVKLEDGEQYSGALNHGTRPTVDSSSEQPHTEVHLINWQGDLYGKQLSCELLEFIRPEKKFDSISELKTQISLDIQQCNATNL